MPIETDTPEHIFQNPVMKKCKDDSNAELKERLDFLIYRVNMLTKIIESALRAQGSLGRRR